MDDLKNLFTLTNILLGLKCIFILCLGYFLGKITSTLFKNTLQQKLKPQTLLIGSRCIHYAFLALFIFIALKELHFDFSIFLGAAGVLSLAIGFASQTSASNIISGLFLVGEKPFQIGDIINVNDITGEVISIDFLSVKLRTFDNLLIRIPNELLIKSIVKNLTRFPIRRVDLTIRVDYHENLDKVKETLMNIASNHILCLENPKPMIIFKEFGEFSIVYQFVVWAAKENFLEVKNNIQEEILKQFKEQNFKIPYPKTIFSKDPLQEQMD